MFDTLTILEDSPGGMWPGVPGYTRHELPPTMIANPFGCHQIPEGWPCFVEPGDESVDGYNDASCPGGPVIENVDAETDDDEMDDGSINATTGEEPPEAPVSSTCEGCNLVDPSQTGEWQNITATPGGNGAFGDRCYTLQEATEKMARHGGHWPGLQDYTIEVLGPLMASDMRACYQLPAGFPCYRQVSEMCC